MKKAFAILTCLMVIVALLCIFTACGDKSTMQSDNVDSVDKDGMVKITVKADSSGGGTVVDEGTHRYAYNTQQTITAQTNDGYTFVGWFEGEEKVCDSLTYTFTVPAKSTIYTAKWACYTISTNTNLQVAGTYTQKTNEKTATGSSVTLTATTYLGYEWLGWYDGETKVSDGASESYTFTMQSENKTYTAKWDVKEEMQNFVFSSDLTTCTIMGIKNKSVTNIVVPDYVTSVKRCAFEGCSGLTSITLPFVGASKSKTINSYIGYIFGANYDYENSDYVPSTLREVVITGGTSIGPSAFYNCSSLNSVTVLDSVTSIGSQAFLNCRGLTSVTIGNSVTSIGRSAFSGCNSLSSISIPDSVASIDKDAFYDTAWYNNQSDGLVYAGRVLYKYKGQMPNNTSIIIEDGTKGITSNAFNWCSGLTSIAIPDSVTNIGEDAFDDTAWYNSQPDGLVYAGKVLYKYKGEMPENTSIIIEDGTKGITGYAFYGCSGLTNITIPNSVTSIGNYAFYGCSGLTSITIPDSVTVIGECITSRCSGLTSIVVEQGNTVYHSAGNCIIETESKTLVLGCKTSVISTDGSVTSIGYDAFYNCSGLTEITIPDSVTSIGDWAFGDCTQLMDIVIPNSVTIIGSYAFWRCSSLTNISIPDSVTHIGCNAFDGCSGLTSVAIGKGVANIDYIAFRGCSGLTSIVVAQGNTKYHSTGNCLIETESKSLILGCNDSVIPTDGSVTSIDSFAFCDCDGLTSIIIPDSVTCIGYSAFSGCSGLTNIIIPDSVTSIERYAFDDCRKLTSITFEGTKAQWNAIDKESDCWDANTGNYIVHCTDGDISK